MKIKDLPKSDRPREKLIAKGAENLKDSELLAILLRTGTKGKNVIEIASHILSKYSKKRLLQMTYQDLAQINGIDSGKATTLLAAFELAKRALEVNDTNLPVINSAKDAVAQLADMRDLKKEHFVVLYLNAKNQLVHKETISMGTLNANLVHPREVFEPALKYSAAQIIAAHNHPSGDPKPSEDDRDVTKRLTEAGKTDGNRCNGSRDYYEKQLLQLQRRKNIMTNIKDLENRLWEAADHMRANSSLRLNEFAEPVLGLIFLKFAGVKFSKTEKEIAAERKAKTKNYGGASVARERPVSSADYHAQGTLFVPEKARFSYLIELPEGTDMGKAVNDAMKEIEAENKELAGILPKSFQNVR